MTGEVNEITTYSVQQAAEMTGLSAHTLRYYERIGLLLPIARDDNGYRRYSEQDIGRIQFLCCLLVTKMPLDAIKRYTQLSVSGDDYYDERIALLEAHRADVTRQVDDLLATLGTIDFKLALYRERQAKETQST